MTAGRPKVLHVAEAFGGGVMIAIEDYVVATPDLEHHLLRATREGHDTGAGTRHFASITDLPHNPLRAVRRLSQVVRSLRPDVVHAHSSVAGALVRVDLAVPRDRIVYTPHCFAFERTDVGAPSRALYRAVERALSLRTAGVAAVGPREQALAARLSRHPRVVYVPNTPPRDAPVVPALRDNRRPVVVAVGRLDPQKDPAFFLDVVRAARAKDLAVDWRWVGGGPAATRRRLEAEGVTVTGWIPRAQAMQEMVTGDIYLHTAAWEGSPFTVLEAAAMRLQLVVRANPAMLSLGPPGLVTTAQEAAASIGALVASGVGAPQPGVEDLLARHTQREQQRALHGLYASVSDAVLPLGGDA
ncbi:MAG: glycosyltransferase [Mycobacteriales bacterium]